MLLRLALLSILGLAVASPAAAQDEAADTPVTRGVTEELPDPTRLDVDRLPPEAATLDRALYAHGGYLEAMMGVRAFVSGLSEVAGPGPMLSLAGGYEAVDDVLFIGARVNVSMHGTDGRRPPNPTVVELVDLLFELRAQWPVSARAALWLSGDFGASIPGSDVLPLYGFQDGDSVGYSYGAELGADGHFLNPHGSVGVRAGFRGYPTLDAPIAGATFSVHGALYLRHVF